MYPPNQPKALLVRPRSSLSTAPDEQGIRRNCCCPTKSFTNLERTLCGFCIILLILCAILLSAIVLIGKSLANSSSFNGDKISYNLYLDKNNTVIDTTSRNNNHNNNGENVIKLKPKIIFKITQEEIDTIQSIQNVKAPSAISTGSNSGEFNTDTKFPELSESADLKNNKFRSNSNIVENSGGSDNSEKEEIKMSKIINKLKFRLPREIIPKHYDLYLQPNLTEKTFNGNVTITVNITKPINFIPIHSKFLTISDTKLIRIDNDGIPTTPLYPINKFMYEPYEYWVMEFKQDLFVGEYWINLSFNGSLTNRIVGFYGSSYFDPIKNQTRLIATSKFEPTYARQAFPCFDEPDLKANFTVTLVRPKDDGYISLSNMDIREEKPDDKSGLTTTYFEESVKMSTYLACFIVSDFDFKQNTIETNGIGENFELKVYSTKAQLSKVDFALEVGKKITEYYIKYFNVPYPLPKLDMAAIPDFVSGAMEHWGLVTFRETSLLYDPQISSTANQQRVGSVVAHELAHMWFGNLVTMKWWNDLWLNEGFASYIQYKGLDIAHPDWKMLDQFLIDGFHGVMSFDATLASHPIVQKVENPDQITALFDRITYQKGAAIIRMLEDFVGQENFQKAVTQYLQKFKYSNAETKDLLREIASIVTEINIEHIMETWTVQMGLPVVNVEKISDTEYKLKQKRFLANPEDENKEHEKSPFNYRWEIPITYLTNVKPETVSHKWFSSSDQHPELIIKLEDSVKIKWIKFNINQIGFYRVNYDVKMWKSLIDALLENPDEFSVSDRAHLLNDAFALSDATQLEYKIALDLTKYLANETEYVPWEVAANQLISMQNLLRHTNSNQNFVEYGRKLIKTIYESVGWNKKIEEGGHLKNLLRVTVLDFACAFGYSKCLDEARTKFTNWLSEDKPEQVDPDIKSIFYKYGMQEAGNEEIWYKVWDKYLKEEDASEKAKLMLSLSSIKDTTILSSFINLAWDEKNVRRQDYFTCLQNIAANPSGEHEVWHYVRDNWIKLAERFGLNERYLGNMIPAITGRFCTETRLKEMNDFFERNPNAGAGESGRKQALANVKIQINWLAKNEKKISDWLLKENAVL